MRILLNREIDCLKAGAYATPDHRKGYGYYIGDTKLESKDFDEVPELASLEDAIFVECEIDCDEGSFDLTIEMIENENSGREYHNSMKLQLIEYEPVYNHMQQLEKLLAEKELRIQALEKEKEQIIKIGVKGQREVNRKLTVEINNAKTALRPLYNIPVQDFDYFEKPSHVLNSWVGKHGTHGLTVQHVLDARKVIDG